MDCTAANLGCQSDKSVLNAYAISREYKEGGIPRGAVTRRFYKGLGFDIERMERSALSGAVIAEHDSMDRYSKKFSRDTADRLLKVEYLDNGAADEIPLDLAWSSPTQLDWSRTFGAAGTVKYDAYGRRRQVRLDDPDDASGSLDLVKVTATDGSGNLLCDGDWLRTSASEPGCAGAVYLGYDALGRPTRVQRGGIDQTTFAYCGMTTTERRFVFTGTQEEAVDVVFEKDGFGRLVKVTEPSPTGTDRVTTYAYDPLDRLTDVSMSHGAQLQTRSFLYDGLGNLRSATEPESGTTTYSRYDARGHLVESTDARGVKATRTYDCAERLIEEEADPPNAEPTVGRRFSFDGAAGQFAGRLTGSESDNFGGVAQLVTQDFEYDERMGRLSKTSTDLLEHHFEQTQTFNSLGLLGVLSYPAASADLDPTRHVLSLSHGYAKGFLDEVRDLTPVQGFDFVTDRGHAPGGLVDFIEFGSTVAPFDQLFAERNRDARGRISSITGHFGSTVLFNSGHYFYDRSNNITAIGGDTFSYFKDGELKSAQYPGVSIGYTYDAFANLRQRTGVEPFSLAISSATNRITDATFEYSDSGNLELDPARVYTWDGLNRLYSAVFQSGSPGSYHLFNADGDRLDQSTTSGCTDGRLLTIRGPHGKVLSEFWSNGTTCLSGATWLRDYIYAGGELVGSRSATSLAAPWICPKMCCPDPGDCFVDVLTIDAPANFCRSDGVNVYSRTATGSYDYANPMNPAPLLDAGCAAPGMLHATAAPGTCYQACSVHKSGALGTCAPEVCPLSAPPFNCSPDCLAFCDYDPPLPPESIRTVYYLTDHLGTPRVTVSSAGEVRETLKLGPFGENLDAASCAQRPQFTGHERDALTNLDYMRARFYAREFGRFLSTDPVRNTTPGDPVAWNAYAYTRNGPTIRIDPDGRIVFMPILAALWVGYEVISQAVDAVTAAKTLADPDASNTEKAAAVTGFAIGMVAPGGGYGTAGKRVAKEVAKEVAESRSRAVIGKLADVAPGKLADGEKSLLKHLAGDLGSPAANWKRNASVLRTEMRKGLPIRDASADAVTGELAANTGFLRAERNLLQSHGWTYSPTSTLWSPPVP